MRLRAFVITMIPLLALLGCGNDNSNCDTKLGVCLGEAVSGKPVLTAIGGQAPPPLLGDNDFDGWPDCELRILPPDWPCDCNDEDGAIAPDRPEQCNDAGRVDEDCDGAENEFDDEPSMQWGFNGDGDGFGKPFTVVFNIGTDTDPLSVSRDDQTFGGCEARGLAAAFLTEMSGGEMVVDPYSVPLIQINRALDGTLIEDCDDDNAFVFPGAPEVCDEVDNDCDGLLDEDATNPGASYLDQDGDGYGAGGAYASCEQPDGYSENNRDCDDNNPDVSPDAEEIPGDHIDQDCDGFDLCYSDSDGDGYGYGPPQLATNCLAEGWSPNALDCDDFDASVNPSVEEDACDGVDNDCDGLLDGADTDTDLIGLTTFWVDLDGDGHGDTETSTEACTLSEGWADNADDCDDNNPDVSPDATEVCDPGNVDEDCNGMADDSSALGKTTWYADVDADGFGSSSQVRVSCEQPSRTSSTSDDCDDFDASVNPSVEEVLYDNKDNDCNPLTEDDACELSTLRLGYWPGDGVTPSDDVEVWVKTITTTGASEYVQWTTGVPLGAVVSTSEDGFTEVEATACVDATNAFMVRAFHNGNLHCATGGQLLVWMDEVMLPSEGVVDPIDGWCAEYAPLAP